LPRRKDASRPEPPALSRLHNCTRRLAAGALGVTVIVSAPVWAEKSKGPKPIETEITIGGGGAETFRQRSQRLERDFAKLRARMVRVARTIQNAETTLTRLERELRSLTAREAALKERLRKGQREHAATLAALQRLALNRPETLVARHQSATRTVRGSILLRYYLRAMRVRAAKLRAELAALRDVRVRITGRRDTIARTTARLAVDRTRLGVMLTKTATMARRSHREQRVALARMRVLAGAARNLRQLLRGVQRGARLIPIGRPVVPRAPLLRRPKGLGVFSTSHGNIISPVRGKIVRKFGDATKIGTFDRGVVFEARLGAQVVAPFDGRVVFAGPFRSYGLILIIDHGGGYHTLLVGLERVDIVVNQWLLGGEPVGAMSSTQSRSTRLYLEIRRRGRPINPLPWLAAQPSKVNG